MQTHQWQCKEKKKTRLLKMYPRQDGHCRQEHKNSHGLTKYWGKPGTVNTEKGDHWVKTGMLFGIKRQEGVKLENKTEKF